LCSLHGEDRFSLLSSSCERRLRVSLLGRDLRPLHHQLVLLGRSVDSHDLQRSIRLGFDEAEDGLDTIALVVRCFHLEGKFGFRRRDDLDSNGASSGREGRLGGVDIQRHFWEERSTV
ncbi:hypothetical protein PMAYCL1PPCAC_01953, partial [Pristionchus mayeri]